MAVRADKRFPGNSEALEMNLMADAVSRAGKPNSVLFSDASDIAVVVCVFKATLKRIVVDVGDRALGFNLSDAHSLKL